MSHQVIFKTAASTSQSIDISLLQNSGSTAAGDPALGLAYNTSNLTAYYQINGTGTLTSISLATQTATGAWSSGGFVKRSDTNAPGLYRFDIPNAVLASAGYAVVSFAGAPAATAGNMETHHLIIMCTAVDLFTAGGGILTTQMSESYAATTVVPTAAQALQMILQALVGFSWSGATLTVTKRDNATTAIVCTANAAANATSLEQTT
jgi:hypothetical protein